MKEQENTSPLSLAEATPIQEEKQNEAASVRDPETDTEKKEKDISDPTYETEKANTPPSEDEQTPFSADEAGHPAIRFTNEFFPTAQAEEDVIGTQELVGGDGQEGGERPDEAETPEAVDYEKIAAEDLLFLKAEFPALAGLSSIAALPRALRYAELRDLGLSPKEAYLAASCGDQAEGPGISALASHAQGFPSAGTYHIPGGAYNAGTSGIFPVTDPLSRANRPTGREHLTSAVPKRAAADEGSITPDELRSARELFMGLGDGEIRKLYRRVTSK